jgi:hypothetical protein
VYAEVLDDSEFQTVREGKLAKERKDKTPAAMLLGFFGWVAVAQCADGLAHTKDLLDSRSLVYYSLTLTIDDSLPVCARCCVRPMAGDPQGAA